MTDRRKLSFRERWLDYEVGDMSTSDTENDSVDNELQLAFDEKTPLAINVTGEEFGKLFASASLGADLLYSEEAHAILWLLWKAVKVGTFCEKVAGCIENSDDVKYQLALLQSQDGGNGGGGTPDVVLPEETREATLLPDGYDCDLDRLYATCRGVTQAIHDATTEVFQAIEILTNPLELAAELADDIPIVELVSIAADTVLWIQNTAFEAYNLAWSEPAKDAISCELFCLIKEYDPCALSLEDIMTVYKDQSFPDAPDIFAPWHEWALWLFELPLGAAVSTVKACGLLGILCMRFGAMFGKFSLGIRSLETTIELLSNDTDPDWAVLCTDCDDLWIHEWDFENYGQDGWGMEAVVNSGGSFVPGQGFVGARVDFTPYTAVLVNRIFWEEASVIPGLTHVRQIYDMVRGLWTVTFPSFYIGVSGGPYVEWNSGFSSTGLDQEKQVVFPEVDTAGMVLYSCASTNNQGNANGTVTVKRIELEGVGQDPFYGRVTADRHIGEV